jgi:sugar lactone lactonase YvrE
LLFKAPREDDSRFRAELDCSQCSSTIQSSTKEMQTKKKHMKAITKLIYSAFAVVTLAIGAMSANAAPGDIFVSDVANNVIHKVAPNGTQSIFATDLAIPEGLAFDSTGYLFEADYGSNTIYKFAPDGTRSVFATGVSPSTGPYGLAFDSAGYLFATDGNGGTIYKFAPDGTPSTFYTGLHNPIAPAFDSAGNLFVSNASNLDYAIYEFAPNATRSTFTTAVSYPIGLAFDSAGYLFEADGDSGNIYKFASDGTRSTFATGLNGPEGLAFDSAGYLFAPAVFSGTLYKFPPGGGSPTIFATGLGNPTFVAIQPPAPTPPAYAAQVQQPINANGTSVFNVRRGVVPVKFTLSQGGVATCALPSATIVLTRTAGGTIGAIDEDVYSGPADTGSNFRIDSCQYVYNLSASALGMGTYRVDIKIDNQVVGSGAFQLK